MVMRPPSVADIAPADGRGIHTFSNGTEYEYWASANCFRCRWYDPEEAGDCAFDSYAILGCVTPECAQQFGWTHEPKWGALSGWNAPKQCKFFAIPPEDDEEPDHPRHTPLCPATLSLFADQRETRDIETPIDRHVRQRAEKAHRRQRS